MAKKREREEEDGGDDRPKKLSKKEMREQAILRARQAMQADKQRVEAVKAKSKAVATGGESARKVAPGSEQKLAVSKKQAREEAIQRAKEYGAKDKEALLKKKAGSRTSVAAAAPQAAQAVVPPAAASHQPAMAPMNQGMAPGAPMNPSMVAQYMMSQKGGGAPFANPNMMGQQPYGGGFGGQSAAAYSPFRGQPQTGPSVAAAAGVQPMQNKLAPNVVPPSVGHDHVTPTPVPAPIAHVPAQAGRARVATAIPDDDDDDDDDDIPPPPTSKLEIQISQQVMANCAAAMNNEPTPFNLPPPEAFSKHGGEEDEYEEEEYIDEHPIIVDDDNETVATSNKRSRKGSLGSNFLTALIVAILSYLLLADVGDSPAEAPIETKSNSGTPCFLDTYPGKVSACPAGTGVQCPSGGLCEGGLLIDCRGKHHEIGEGRDACVLDHATNTTLSTLEKLLEEWSVKELCSLGASTEMPLFEYSELQLANPGTLATNPLSILLLESHFETSKRDGELVVGLVEEHPLKLPLACKSVRLAKKGLSSMGSLLVVFVHSLLSAALDFFISYPLASLIGLVVLFAVKRSRDFQVYRTKLVRDIAQVRQMAYQFLQENASQAHVVLHIRDEIAMALYADSKSQRRYLISEVWPRVVPDFKNDNRVRKSNRVMEGRPREVWQWVAVASMKKGPRFGN